LIEEESKVLKITKLKHQISNKLQYPNLNYDSPQLFGILNLGHCDLFGICDLLFEILYC
jgi:hypothetical protein